MENRFLFGSTSFAVRDRIHMFVLQDLSARYKLIYHSPPETPYLRRHVNFPKNFPESFVMFERAFPT
jgi:hypothetical protein